MSESIQPVTTQPAPAPSERDQLIFSEVRSGGRRQKDVAAEHGLTQARVSQIMAKVAAYFARVMPGLEQRLLQAQDFERIGRECLARRQRLMAKGDVEFERSRRPLVTTITHEKTDQGWIQTIVREQRPEMRYLKLQQQENDKLAAWAEKSAECGTRCGRTRLLPSRARAVRLQIAK